MASAEPNPWIFDHRSKEYYLWNASENCYIYQSGRKAYLNPENVTTGDNYQKQPQDETVPRLAKNGQSVSFVPTARPREPSGGSNQYEVVNEGLAGFTVQDEPGIENEPIEETDAVSQESVDYEEVGEQSLPAQAKYRTLSPQENTGQTYSYPISRTYPTAASYSYPQSSNQPATTPLEQTVSYTQSPGFSGHGTHFTTASVTQPNYPTYPPVASPYPKPAYEIVEAGVIPGKKDAGRARQSTHPGNPKEGLAARKRLGVISESTQVLDPKFQVRRPGYDFFKIGKVFKVVWPELAGDSDRVTTTMEWRKEKIYVKVRWFVVIREGHDCCSCLPIQTHGGKGASNKVKGHHAIIYTGNEVPQPLDTETTDRRDQLLRPIRVTSHQKYEKLDPLSRINFYKIYNVEHNVKVYDFGQVHRDSEFWLQYQFKSAWGIDTNRALPSSVKPRSRGGSRRSSRSAYNPTSSNTSEIALSPGTDLRSGYASVRGPEARTIPAYVPVAEYQKKQPGAYSYMPTSVPYGSRTLDAHESSPRSRSHSRARQPGTLSSEQQDTPQYRGSVTASHPLDPYGYCSTAPAPNPYSQPPKIQDESEEEEDEDEDEEVNEEPEEDQSRQHSRHSKRIPEVVTQGRERTRPKSGRAHPEVKKKGERRHSSWLGF